MDTNVSEYQATQAVDYLPISSSVILGNNTTSALVPVTIFHVSYIYSYTYTYTYYSCSKPNCIESYYSFPVGYVFINSLLSSLVLSYKILCIKL